GARGGGRLAPRILAPLPPPLPPRPRPAACVGTVHPPLRCRLRRPGLGEPVADRVIGIDRCRLVLPDRSAVGAHARSAGATARSVPRRRRSLQLRPLKRSPSLNPCRYS